MKVQDLFKGPDGSNIFDSKVTMKILDIPTEAVEVPSTSGRPSLFLFPVKMECAGQVYEWNLSQAQIERMFTKTPKGSKVASWVAAAGDIVNVWYATPKTAGGHPYFAVEPSHGAPVIDTAKAVDEIFGDGPTHNSVPVPSTPVAKPKFAPFVRQAKTEWDGSPRQSSFRQGYAGMLQAILSNPNFNPRVEEDVNFAKVLAQELVEEVRVTAKILEEKIKD